MCLYPFVFHDIDVRLGFPVRMSCSCMQVYSSVFRPAAAAARRVGCPFLESFLLKTRTVLPLGEQIDRLRPIQILENG